MTATFRGLPSKEDSRTWRNFTRNGLRLEYVHQAPPCTDISWISVAFCITVHSWTIDNIRNILPRTQPLLKSFFSDECKFCILFWNLCSRVWNKCGEICFQSCVVFSHQWWLVVPCYLLVVVHFVWSSPKSSYSFNRF